MYPPAFFLILHDIEKLDVNLELYFFLSYEYWFFFTLPVPNFHTSNRQTLHYTLNYMLLTSYFAKKTAKDPYLQPSEPMGI